MGNRSVNDLLKQEGRGTVSGESGVASMVQSVVRNGGGRPLDLSTRQVMDSMFGEDFRDVRIHTDRKAHESAAEINARAYTYGRNIVFRAGEYAPETTEGRRLLAHELTHVVQQRAGVRVHDALSKENPYEQSADLVAERVTKGEYADNPLTCDQGPKSGGAHEPMAPSIQRKEDAGKSAGRGQGEKERSEKEASLTPSIEAKTKIFQREFPMRDVGGGWVEAGLGVTIELKGRATSGKQGTKLAVSDEGEVEIAKKIETELGDIELKLEGEPGTPAKLAFEFGGQVYGLEASAKADWERPFTFAAKHKIPEREASFLGTEFEGELEISYEVSVGPGKKLLVAASRAISRTAVEVVGSTEFAVIGTTVLWFAWVALGLASAGKAGYEGKEETIGRLFSRGYASMLARLSEPQVSGVNPDLLKVQWRGLLEEERRAYHEPGTAPTQAGVATSLLVTAGEAMALQGISKLFPSEAERSRWAEAERDAFGANPHTREALYFADLEDQVMKGIAPADLFIHLRQKP